MGFQLPTELGIVIPFLELTTDALIQRAFLVTTCTSTILTSSPSKIRLLLYPALSSPSWNLIQSVVFLFPVLW